MFFEVYDGRLIMQNIIEFFFLVVGVGAGRGLGEKDSSAHFYTVNYLSKKRSLMFKLCHLCVCVCVCECVCV